MEVHVDITEYDALRPWSAHQSGKVTVRYSEPPKPNGCTTRARHARQDVLGGTVAATEQRNADDVVKDSRKCGESGEDDSGLLEARTDAAGYRLPMHAVPCVRGDVVASSCPLDGGVLFAVCALTYQLFDALPRAVRLGAYEVGHTEVGVGSACCNDEGVG